MQRSKAWSNSVALLPILLFFAILLVSSPASAQDIAVDESAFGVEMTLDQGSVYVEFQRQQRVNVTLQDVSLSYPDNAISPLPHRIELSTEIVGDESGGWYVSTPFRTFQTRPGDTHTFPVRIETTALLEEPVVEVNLEAKYIPRGGDGGSSTNATILAVAQPNPRLSMISQGAPERFTPDAQRQIPMLVQNEDYYPNMITFSARAPEGWIVSPPSSIQLGPKEATVVHFYAKAPQEPWFRLNPSSDQVSLEAEIVDGGMISSQGVQTPISGWFLPGWVIPHLVLLFLGAGVLIRRGVGKARENRLRKGRPSFPGLPPEKAARYEALKVAKPAKAESMEARLKKVHKDRKASWKQAYKAQRKKDSSRRRNVNSRRRAILNRRKEQAKQEKEEKEKLQEQRARREDLLQRKRALEEATEREEGRREDELTDRMRDEREDA